ncbi:uncharacterized protein LOC119990130 isoform X1 [Tripterygium wilfordii]|nr:uncharacterized protein LOC119990130 isoform X1 [Tripterygium wilfordii]
MASSRFLFSNGVLSHSSDIPDVRTFLESNPGAYTTTRTHNNASCLLFWERHLRRLANSARILCESNPPLLFKSGKSTHSLSLLPSVWESVIRTQVNESMREVLPVALGGRRYGEELAVTAHVSGDLMTFSENKTVDEENLSKALDVHVHIGAYVPPEFGVGGTGAHLAVVGRGRDVAAAKYSEWVRLRKPLEKLRPPSVTELLLSNDGDRILEGCLTNFFVVCPKDIDEIGGEYLHDYKGAHLFEVQTAPIGDGVLPGIIRQLVIDVCLSKGISVREVAPSWFEHEKWKEAFITNSLRLMQHVQKIQVPISWESIEQKTWQEIVWKEKHFKESPGKLITLIQKEIMDRADLEGYPCINFA